MPSHWTRLTAFVVIVLPLTILYVGTSVRSKGGPSAVSLAAMLGAEGAVLALAAFGYVAIVSYREIKEPNFGNPIGFDSRMKIWGFVALAVYILSWLAALTWLVT